MSAKVTIEALKVDATKTLTVDQKKAMVKIVEEEFINQSTMYNAKATEDKAKILAQYRRGVGYATLETAYRKAEAAKDAAEKKMEEVERKIQLKGLSVEGEQLSEYYAKSDVTAEMKAAIAKLSNLFKVVEQASPARTRNKVVARLWLATTQGEACVILEQVLGNGIIPTMTPALLTQQ